MPALTLSFLTLFRWLSTLSADVCRPPLWILTPKADFLSILAFKGTALQFLPDHILSDLDCARLSHCEPRAEAADQKQLGRGGSKVGMSLHHHNETVQTPPPRKKHIFLNVYLYLLCMRVSS